MTAQRRLSEEMGLIATLTEAFTFSYQADVGNGLTENEFDHVFIGVSNQNPNPNPAEVSDWNWVTVEELEQELIRNPKKYSSWLRQCFSEVINYKLQEPRQVANRYQHQCPLCLHLNHPQRRLKCKTSARNDR